MQRQTDSSRNPTLDLDLDLMDFKSLKCSWQSLRWLSGLSGAVEPLGIILGSFSGSHGALSDRVSQAHFETPLMFLQWDRFRRTCDANFTTFGYWALSILSFSSGKVGTIAEWELPQTDGTIGSGQAGPLRSALKDQAYAPT